MAGMKIDPLRELHALQEQIARRMEERLGAGTRIPAIDSIPENKAGAWTPAMDLYETAQAFVLFAELPGFEDRDVTLTIDGRVLTVRGNRKGPGAVGENSETRKSKRGSRVETRDPAGTQEFHRMEREYGAFQRSFTLPGAVDPTRMTTRWADGVLEVKLSKKTPKSPSKPEKRR